MGAIRGTRPDSGCGLRPCVPDRFESRGAQLAYAAGEARLYGLVAMRRLLRTTGWSGRRDRGGNAGRDLAGSSVASRGGRSGDRHGGGHDHGGRLAGVAASGASHGVAIDTRLSRRDWCGLVFAAAIGMILAALFAILLSTAKVTRAELRRDAESHYAAPASPPIDRSSMVPAAKIVSGGGW